VKDERSHNLHPLTPPHPGEDDRATGLRRRQKRERGRGDTKRSINRSRSANGIRKGVPEEGTVNVSRRPVETKEEGGSQHF
jgi:hypothetical protein